MRSTKKYSPAEPVTDLRHIRIVDDGEPLVDYLAACPLILKARPRWQYERAQHLRLSVARMLCNAAGSLPHGYRLAVIEGWRPPYIQRRLYLSAWNRWRARHPEWSEAQLRRVVNRFTAPLHGKVPPPHSTGAALDVLLADEHGTELDMSSPYELFDPKGYGLKAPNLSEAAASHRRILSEALEAGGLTNYPSEWWHWSYGDQGWAYRTGNPTAIYGPTAPADWTGPASDQSDEPLERVQR
ncbi:MAG: dipeptidase [Armatimonadetes bacterium]|nr:dipeptidase [Armatimonadota bacterium]